jgi:hypothetical protein
MGFKGGPQQMSVWAAMAVKPLMAAQGVAVWMAKAAGMARWENSVLVWTSGSVKSSKVRSVVAMMMRAMVPHRGEGKGGD